MPQIIVASAIATAISIVVFFLPVFEIYSGFYLSPFLSSLPSLDSLLPYKLAMSFAPIFAAVSAVTILLFSARKVLSVNQFNAALCIPAITLSFGSNMIGRYDLTLTLLFVGTLVTTLIIIKLLARKNSDV